MISASWSLSRPGFTSTAMPRSLNICTAAGESLSEMRTLGGMTQLSSRDPDEPQRNPEVERASGAAFRFAPCGASCLVPRSRRARQRFLDGDEGPLEPGRERLE